MADVSEAAVREVLRAMTLEEAVLSGASLPSPVALIQRYFKAKKQLMPRFRNDAFTLEIDLLRELVASHRSDDYPSYQLHAHVRDVVTTLSPTAPRDCARFGRLYRSVCGATINQQSLGDEARIGRLLFFGIAHCGLISSRALLAFCEGACGSVYGLRRLAHLELMISVDEGPKYLRRVYLDLVTERLWLESSDAFRTWASKDTSLRALGERCRLALRSLFLEVGASPDDIPVSLGGVLTAATEWLRLAMGVEQILIEQARGDFAIPSVELNRWWRCNLLEPLSKPVPRQEPESVRSAVAAEANRRDRRRLLAPLAKLMKRGFDAKSLKQARELVNQLATAPDATSNIRLVAAWVIWSGGEGGIRKRRAGPSGTNYLHYKVLVPRMLAFAGEQDIREMNDDRLKELFADVAGSCEGAPGIRNIVRACQSLARFLKTSRADLDIDGVVPNIPAPTMRHATRLISRREMREAWDSDHLLAGLDYPEPWEVTKAIIVGMYYGTLRTGEAMGLTPDEGQGDDIRAVQICRNIIRTLKSNHAKRFLVLDHLDPDAAKLLECHLRTYFPQKVVSFDNEGICLRVAGGERKYTWKTILAGVSRVLRRVTGDASVVPYDLRRSGMTWLFASLLAPALQLERFESVLPALRGVGERTDFLRKALLPMPSIVRSEAHVIAERAGQLGPATALKSYLPLGDIMFHAALGKRLTGPAYGELVAAVCHFSQRTVDRHSNTPWLMTLRAKAEKGFESSVIRSTSVVQG